MIPKQMNVLKNLKITISDRCATDHKSALLIDENGYCVAGENGSVVFKKSRQWKTMALDLPNRRQKVVDYRGHLVPGRSILALTREHRIVKEVGADAALRGFSFILPATTRYIYFPVLRHDREGPDPFRIFVSNFREEDITDRLVNFEALITVLFAQNPFQKKPILLFENLSEELKRILTDENLSVKLNVYLRPFGNYRSDYLISSFGVIPGSFVEKGNRIRMDIIPIAL